MIVTTTDATIKSKCKDFTSVTFNGMIEKDYRSFLTSDGAIKKDDDIRGLIQVIGTLPIVLNSAKRYINKANISVNDYIELFKDKTFETKLEVLREYEEPLYEKDLLKSQKLPLQHIRTQLLNDGKHVLVEVLDYLPYLQYDQVCSDVLRALYFNIKTCEPSEIMIQVDLLIAKCSEFSICHVETVSSLSMSSPESKMEILSFHEVTIAALGSCENGTIAFENSTCSKSTKRKGKRPTRNDNKDRRLKRLQFLLKLFCYEIDIDARTDKTLERNMFFLPHASKLLSLLQTADIGSSKEILFYLSYLHCAIGSTLLFQRTDIESAHTHLMKARRICLYIVNDKTYFTKDVCTFNPPRSTQLISPSVNELERVARNMLNMTFDKTFVEEFIFHKRRGENDIDAIRKQTDYDLFYQQKNLCYLSKEQYTKLVTIGLAKPVKALQNTFLIELFHRILHNNGRSMHELKYVIADGTIETLKMAYHNEFFNSNEICKIYQTQCNDFPSFVSVEFNRSGRMLLHFSQSDISPETLRTDIEYYESEIKNPVTKCFEFGIIKMSSKSNNRHISMCRRILLKYIRNYYKMLHDGSEKKDLFEKGRKVSEELIMQIQKMENTIEKFTWLSIPLLYNECAKFLQLSSSDQDLDQAVRFYDKSIQFECRRNIKWSRFLQQGYFGKIRSLKKLQKEDKANDVINDVEKMLSGANRKNLIKRLNSFKKEL